MSEISPTSEAPISNAIKTSTKYAFGLKPKESLLAGKIRKVEEESRGVKERLLGMIGSVAKEADVLGFDFTNEVDRWCAATIWKTAQERVGGKLKKVALTNPGLVFATLNDLDPMDIPVNNLGARLGEPTKSVRRSVGLEAGANVRFVDSNAQSAFHENPEDPNQIVLGGQSFIKDSVIRTLDGEGELKPMWKRDGVSVPLISIQTGEIFIVSLDIKQLGNLGVLWEEGKQTAAMEKLIDPQEIKYGAHGLSSPDHPNEDDFGNITIFNPNGEVVGLRFFSIDGSGGALKGTNFPESSHAQIIIEKVRQIKRSLLATTRTLSSETALRFVDKQAKADQSNPAFAGVVMVDVFNDRYEIARKGDHSVVRWRPKGYDHRRGEMWGKERGGPSFFESIDRPQNSAYALKSIGMGGETRFLEDTPGSNLLFSGVGTTGEVATVLLERSNETEYFLILSDGARGSGMLLEPSEKYSKDVNNIMTKLNSGSINEKEAAKQIAITARQIPGERDDISVQVVKLPSKKVV